MTAPVFGYITVAGRFIANPAQARALRLIRRLHGQGFSLREIRDALAVHGVQLSHEGVRATLDRMRQGSDW
jgi:DNA-binding transcriptional MerR regulator